MNQEPDEHTKEWTTKNKIADLLVSFKNFANDFNDACDAEENSFDAMVLLTGNMKFEDVLDDPGMKINIYLYFIHMHFRLFARLCIHI